MDIAAFPRNAAPGSDLGTSLRARWQNLLRSILRAGDIQMFQRSYRVMSVGWTVALPLILIGMNLLAYVVLGLAEPEMHLECDKAKGLCTVEERTWISRTGPTTLELAKTRFDAERQGKTTRLSVRTADGKLAFQSGLSNASARTVTKRVAAFSADPGAQTLVLDEGFPRWVILCFIPVALLIAAGPMWGLGGSLLVRAEPGLVHVTRVRLGWKKELELAFPPTEVPRLTVLRDPRYKRRNQGALLAHASTGEVALARQIAWRVLEPIRDDLATYFGARS